MRMGRRAQRQEHTNSFSNGLSDTLLRLARRPIHFSPQQPVSRRKSIHATLDRLAEAERAFLGNEFLAPVLRGQGVQVRIAGVRCRLAVEPADFDGFGVFRPASHVLARLVRPARMAERRAYLDLFPSIGLILVTNTKADGWLALPASRGDRRVQFDGAVPVRLVEDAEPLESIRARFDGMQFWFDEIDPRAEAGAGGYMRQSLAAMLDPRQLERPGLTAEQREAYAALHAARLRRQMQDARAAGERRLRAALDHAAASLDDFIERGDVYTVTYAVDGRRHTSVVNRRDLSIHTAGICLSGEDAVFDLTSLVGVLREADDLGR